MTQFQEVGGDSLRDVAFRIPRELRELLFAAPNKLFVAGGVVRDAIAGGSPSDIDVFGSERNYRRALNEDIESRWGVKGTETENATTLIHPNPARLPIQVIHRWEFNAAIDVLRSFDFTVCQAVFWADGDRFRLIVGPTFFEDLAARRLVYTAPERDEDAAGSLLRVVKFVSRGYTVRPAQLARVVARGVRGLDAAQSEEALASDVEGRLRQVDPLRIIDGILVDEDRAPEGTQ